MGNRIGGLVNLMIGVKRRIRADLVFLRPFIET